ncbi:MAG TPA: hypothetical protein VGI56_14510 [Galbitalea sp.]|jgi:hypothetical protein
MAIKRKTIAIVAGLAVFAAVSASAATLGGLTTNDLGANSAAVAGQLTGGVTVTFTTAYDATLGGYKITGVNLAGTTATEKFPVGANIALTVKGTSNASLVELTATQGAASNTASLTYAGPTISAYSVQGAALVVNGGAVTTTTTTP